MKFHVLLLTALFALAQPPAFNLKPKTGPAVGTPAPDFALRDHRGQTQSFANLRGRKGLVLLFLPSADWCPYCKAQLVELEEQKKRFAQRGLNVAAITNESPALLANFAKRRGITYPLLSDSGSRTIRDFDLMNDAYSPGHQWHGIPHPGTIVLDAKGVVQAKYFEADYRERYTAGSLIGSSGDWSIVETEHLKLRYSPSNRVVRAGNRISLRIEAELKPGLHVYAPGVASTYQPVTFKIGDSPGLKAHEAQFPRAKVLTFPSIGESLPTFSGKFSLTRDVTLAQDEEVRPLLVAEELLSRGTFAYQPCTRNTCLAPVEVPLLWKLRYAKPDLDRVPEPIRKESFGIHLNLFQLNRY